MLDCIEYYLLTIDLTFGEKEIYQILFSPLIHCQIDYNCIIVFQDSGD